MRLYLQDNYRVIMWKILSYAFSEGYCPWLDARGYSGRVRHSSSLGMFHCNQIPIARHMQIMSGKDQDKLTEFLTFPPDALTACFSDTVNDVYLIRVLEAPRSALQLCTAGLKGLLQHGQRQEAHCCDTLMNASLGRKHPCNKVTKEIFRHTFLEAQRRACMSAAKILPKWPCWR